MVDVVIAGSDAGVILTGVKRDAQRVGEDLKDSAVASAASAVRSAQTFTKWLLRLVTIVVAMAVVIATSIIVGVYRPLVGLAILLLGSAIVVLWVQRSSKRRRTQQPDAGTSLRVR
jgi:Flp pilus assembly protein TadB